MFHSATGLLHWGIYYHHDEMEVINWCGVNGFFVETLSCTHAHNFVLAKMEDFTLCVRVAETSIHHVQRDTAKPGS